MHNIYRLKYPNYDVHKNKIEIELRFLFVLFLIISPDRPVPSELFYGLRYPGPQEGLSGGIYRFLFHKFPAVLLLVKGEGIAVSCLKREDSAVRCLSIIAEEKRCIPLDSCLPRSCVVLVYKIGMHCREYEDACYLGKRKIEKYGGPKEL